MQYVNDDMDDLYKSAAENYPLNIGKPDWNKVYNVLKETDEPKPVRQKNNRKYLWLLCLLPLGFVCNRYFTGNGPAFPFSLKTQDDNRAETKKMTPSSQNGNVPVTLNSSSEKKVSAKETNESTALTIITHNKINSETNKFLLDKNLKDTRVQTPGDNLFRSKSSKKRSLSGNDAVINSASEEEQPLHFIPELLTTKYPGEAVSLKLLSVQRNTVSSSSGPAVPPIQKSKHFYVGLFGGIDFTTVHLQKAGNAGSHYGGLLGYHLGKNWSVEAGVFADKKFYATEGKYFNASKIYLPPNTEITDVTGDCKMLEFPVSLKYDFSPARKSTWFVAGGLSSYVVKKENYSYVYYYGSSGTSAVHEKSYNNSSTNLFSVIQLSGGYTHSIGRTTSLRIEPYLKLPLSGMGFGQLHLISTGVNAGVVKRF